MIYIVLLTIIILFFFYALILAPIVKKYLKIRMCPICSACSSVWILLLFLRFLKIIKIDPVILAVLMGGSTVGIMYALQNYFIAHNIKRFYIVRILEVITGFYLAYSLALWNLTMILIGLVGVFITFLAFIILTRNRYGKRNGNVNELTKRDKQKLKNKSLDKKQTEYISEEEKQRAISKIEKSLEDCCV